MTDGAPKHVYYEDNSGFKDFINQSTQDNAANPIYQNKLPKDSKTTALNML